MSRRNRKKESRNNKGAKSNSRKSPHVLGMRGLEELEVRSLLSAAPWIDEGASKWLMSYDTKATVGQIGTPDQPTATYTGGLQSTFGGGFDLDRIPFSLAATGNENTKIRVQFTPSTANGQPAIPTKASGADLRNNVNLQQMFAVANSLQASSVRTSGGGAVVNTKFSYPDDSTIEWSLNGVAAGNYELHLFSTAGLGSALVGGRGFNGVSYNYEAVFESFPNPPGTPDVVKGPNDSTQINLPFPAAGQTLYGAGYLEGSSAPGTFMNDDYESVSYQTLKGMTITTLVADAGAATITSPTVNFMDDYGYIQIVGPTSVNFNQFTWINPNDAQGSRNLNFSSPSDQGGTGYQVFVENYGVVPTSDYTETLTETVDSTVNVPTGLGLSKPTTTVSGILRSYNEPNTKIGVNKDIDRVTFLLPSRGVSGSQAVISLSSAGTAINTLINARLNGPNGSTIDGVYDAPTNTLRFDMAGADGGNYVLTLESVSANRGAAYQVSLTNPLPTVSFGPINYTTTTEGFGYGSTIAGLGKAVDTTTPSVIDGALSNSLGIKESNKFTIENWYYPKTGVTNGVIWSFGTTYQLVRVDDTGLRLRVVRSGAAVDGGTFDITVSGALNKEAWNHLAATFDGERLRLYANGVVIADVPDTVADYDDVFFVNPPTMSLVQAAVPGITQVGTGAIDELRVWNLARTQSELQDTSLTPLLGSEAGLVGYWNFDNPSDYLELDSSKTGNKINVSPLTRIEKPAPQIGYVDVILDRSVDNPAGLWVTYNITGGTAIPGTDFVSSSFRKVSDVPGSEKYGIIIPDKESSGRIYFYAKPDAIAEPNETVNISLTTNSFLNVAGGRDYNVGSASVASVNITDNGAYKQGVQITDSAGRPISSAFPLYIPVTTGQADIKVKLTSQPDFPSVNPQQVAITIGDYPNVAILSGGVLYASKTLIFTPDNWDVPQTVTLTQALPLTGSFKITGTGYPGSSYINTPIAFPFTQVAPTRADVGEGNPTDVSPVTPTVNLVTIRSGKENDDQPALVQVNLNTAAPAGGLDVYYTVAGAPTAGATPGTDFALPTGVIHVEEGETQAVIPISMIDDEVSEGTESFLVKLATNSKYILGTTSQATVNLLDNDVARIVISNPSFVDVTNTKSLIRPGLDVQESGSIYAYGDSPKQLLGSFGTFDAPGFTYSGGISSSFSGQFDRDTIEFTLATAGDANTKLSVQFKPTSANGEAMVPTVGTGSDGVTTLAILGAFDAGTGTGTRLTGGSLVTPKKASVPANDRLEWSLAGLAAGTYQLILSGSPVLSQILGSAEGSTGVSYDYVATLTTSATAPYTLSTTSTITNYSPTYAPLVTNETVPAPTLALEPNNTIATAYSLGTVFDGTTIANQMIDSPTDVDYYRFTLDSKVGRPDTLALLFNQATGDSKNDLQVWLYNSAGSYLLSINRSSANEYMDLSSLADGDYHISVRGTSAAIVSTNYTLKFRTLTNPAEPTGAQPIYLGVASNGDRYNDFAVTPSKSSDAFRFTLDTASGRPSSVNLLTVPTDGNLGISLYSKTGTLLLSNNSADALKTLSLVGLGDGDYEVRISPPESGTFNKYDLAFGTVSTRASQTDPNQIALRLDSKPLANVTLTLVNSGPSEGRLSTSTVVFTPANWNQYQLVQVTPIDDGTADGDKTYTVTATTSSTDAKYQNKTLTFNITNVDRGNFVPPAVQNTNDEPNAPVVTISAIPTIPRSEGTTVDGFLLTLSKPATENLTIKLDYQRGTAVYGSNFTVDTGTGNPNEVIIPAGTTSKAIKVTLIDNGIDDSATNVNKVIQATVVDMPKYRPATTADPGYTADFEIADVNVAGIIVNGPNGPAASSVASTSEVQSVPGIAHTVRLATKPVANVTVYIASSDSDAGVIQIDPAKAGTAVASLLFTPANWNVNQTFYVKGVENNVDDARNTGVSQNKVPYKFVVSAQSEDDPYRLLPKQSFDALNTDDDNLGIFVTSPQNTINGRTNVFSVVLNSQPLGEVRVTMTPQNDQIEINGSRAGDPATLVFGPTNWNIAQLVKVVAIDDRVIEYIHESKITFSVDTGRHFNLPTSADISVASQALDLGDIAGGIRWTNLNLPPVGDADLSTAGDQWYRITLAKMGTSLNAIRLLTAGDNRTDLPNIALYSKDGSTFIKSGVVTAGSAVLGLDKIAAGEYLIRIFDNGITSVNTQFDMLIDDADRDYEKVVINPVTVSIVDNDVPLAEVIAGTTASEVFSEPSYFAVRLSAPASAEGSESGVKVNFKVSGGRASQGVTTSTLHDYTVVADYFNPTSGMGWVRVAPGDVQANIGIVPVDDKLVEDLPVAISDFGYNPTLGYMVRVASKPDSTDPVYPYDPNYMLPAGTILKIQITPTQEVEVKVRVDTPLVLGFYGPTGSNFEYAAAVPIDELDPATIAAIKVLTANPGNFKGRVESEDVQVTLLGGIGYSLPLAPDKQGADPAIPSNLDQNRITSRMTIYDDDVAGVQIIEMGDHTTVAEGDTTTFKVVLTAEPKNDVYVTLTPGGGFEFVNPPATSSQPLDLFSYSYDDSSLPNNIDLNFVSLHETDLGYTAVFDGRLGTVSQGLTATKSVLKITGGNGGGSSSASYDIPGADDVDFAGVAVEGTWNTFQRIVVGNLKPNANGSFTLTINLDGVEKNVTLTPIKSTVNRTAAVLKFTPSTWFNPQTLTIQATDNAVAEPGEYHKDIIRYTTQSEDPIWDDLTLPLQEVRILDTRLDVGDTINGLEEGLNLLEDSLLGLKLPLIGSIGELPGLGIGSSSNAPTTSGGTQLLRTADVSAAAASIGGLGFFEDFRGPLKKALSTQTDMTVTKFKVLAESTLQPLVKSGLFDRIVVTPTANDSDVNVVFNLDKVIKIASLDLSSDLGLDALGLRFQTTGKASLDLAFSLDVGFGWNKQFGFYIDTAQTGIQVGARLYLSGNGATTDNPDNLFTGQGAIGGLQLDFSDDPVNRTELSLTFQINLNDLDNVNTVKFFDVNGDGLLADKPFTFNVGVDANKDGRIDKDASGNPVTAFRTIEEAWANIGQDATADPFPTIPSIKNNPDVGDAVKANWNTVGSKTNTFDEATSIQKEGIYRLKTQGNKTIAYLDLDRDGQLDVGKKNLDPFAFPWTSMNDANRMASDIWFTPADPKNLKELKVLTKVSGTTTKYYLDINQDNKGDAFELITADLYKKLDKNASKTLEGDVISDGEGKYAQGTSIDFYDTNNNGKLDFNEPFVSLGFDPFQLPISAFTEDSTGKKFLDFNGDGSFNSGQLTTAPEFLLKYDAAANTNYVDMNGDSARNPNEPQAGRTRDTLFVQQSAIDPVAMTINFNGQTYNVITINGTRFIDLDGDGKLTLDRKGRALEPFAIQSTKISNADRNALVLKIDSIDPAVFSTVATEITKLRLNQTLSAAENQRVINRFNDLVRSGKIDEQVNDGNRLTLAELKAFVNSNKAANTTKADQVKGIASQLFTYSFKGEVNIGLKTKTSINGSKVLPSVKFDLDLNYPLFNIGNAKDADATGLTVNFKNVGIDMGTFLGDYVEPILKTVDNIIKPIKPLIKALNADTKIFGKIGLASSFESDGKPGISLLEIARKLSAAFPDQQAKIDKAIKFADTLTKLSSAIDKLTGALTDERNLLSFGDFSLSDFRAASDDLANSASKAKNAPRLDNSPRTTVTLPNTNAGALSAQAQKSSAFKDKFNALRDLDGFEISLFNPSTVLGLITGEDNVDLIKYDIPDVDFSFMLDKSFPIWGPISGLLEGGFSVKTDLAFGFDTHGIEEWAKEGYAADKSYLVFDGLYLNDWTPSGAEKDELTVQAYVAAGVGLDVGIASGYVKGGIEGIIGFDVVDTGERAGTNDGKVRGTDIIHGLSNNPADLFSLHGTVNVFLGAEINVNLLFFSATVYESRLATIQIVKFQLDTSGLSGSSIAGKIETGPLSGATVWFDANNNFMLDDDEPFTKTNFEGDYELIIPDDIDQSVGAIRVQGGVDVSTGNHQNVDISIPVGSIGDATAFTALEDRLDLLPIDTTRIDMNQDFVVDDIDRTLYLSLQTTNPSDPLLDVNGDGIINDADLTEFDELLAIAQHGGVLTTEQSAARIKKAFGIDQSVDFATFLHFEEALAGNPLASPVMLGENSLNTFVEQGEALLAGLAGVGLNDHPYSDLFSEAIFDAVARQLLSGNLDLADPNQVRAILLDAANHADQLIGNFNAHIDFARLNSILDDVTEVLTASMTMQRILANDASGPAEVARFITEAKVVQNGKVVDDIYQVALGNESSSELVSNDGRLDAAAIDELKHVSLPPLIHNVDDVFLFEDDIAQDIPIVATSQMGDNSSLTVTVSSDNSALLPASSLILVPTGVDGEYRLTINPVADHFGTATLIITVLDNSDGKTSEERVNVTVAFRNHDPQTLPIHTFAIAGESIDVNPLLIDQDVDGQTLQVGLLTAPLGGEFSIINHQTIRFTPDADFTGQVVVEYEIDDGNGGSAIGFITFDVVAMGMADQSLVTIAQGSQGINTGTIPIIPGSIATLSSSIGSVISTGANTWEWFWNPDSPSDAQDVTITASYDNGMTSQVHFDVIVTNTGDIPQLHVDAPAQSLLYQGTSFTLTANHVAPLSGGDFGFLFDWDNNGTFDRLIVGPNGMTVSHEFSSLGLQTFRAAIEAPDGSILAEQLVSLDIVPFAIVPNSSDPNLSDLYLSGTAGEDSFVFEQIDDETILVTTLLLNGFEIDAPPVTYTGITGGIHVFTGSGNDKIDAAGISTKSTVLFGGDGDDTILGGNGENYIDADGSEGRGNDFVQGGIGKDTIYADGVKGLDRAGDFGRDTVYGGDDDDVIYSDGAEGSSSDYVDGGAGNDTIHGNGDRAVRSTGVYGSDTILGGTGDDIIIHDGAEGAGDSVLGGEGNDLVIGGNANDTISGGADSDVIIAGAGADYVNGDSGSDLIIAGIVSGIDIAGWQLVQSEWTSPRPLANRVENILGNGAGPRNNADTFLTASNTQLDDQAVDTILGGADGDWLLFENNEDETPDEDALIDVLTDVL